MADFPIPPQNPESAPFFKAAAAGRFMLRRCVSCGQTHWYPRSICPFCQGRTEWFEASGKGRIHTFSTFMRSNEPYTLAYVELEEGPIMLTNLVLAEPDSLRIGGRVRVCFQQASDGTAIACFAPDS